MRRVASHLVQATIADFDTHTSQRPLSVSRGSSTRNSSPFCPMQPTSTPFASTWLEWTITSSVPVIVLIVNTFSDGIGPASCFWLFDAHGTP